MQITGELVTLFILVGGFVLGIWWRVEGKIEAAAQRARDAASDLEKYKTFTAERYVSKSGLREFRDEVMSGVREIKESVTHLNSRIDRVIEEKDHKPRPRTRSTD